MLIVSVPVQMSHFSRQVLSTIMLAGSSGLCRRDPHGKRPKVPRGPPTKPSRHRPTPAFGLPAAAVSPACRAVRTTLAWYCRLARVTQFSVLEPKITFDHPSSTIPDQDQGNWTLPTSALAPWSQTQQRPGPRPCLPMHLDKSLFRSNSFQRHLPPGHYNAVCTQLSGNRPAMGLHLNVGEPGCSQVSGPGPDRTRPAGTHLSTPIVKTSRKRVFGSRRSIAHNSQGFRLSIPRGVRLPQQLALGTPSLAPGTITGFQEIASKGAWFLQSPVHAAPPTPQVGVGLKLSFRLPKPFACCVS